MHGATKCIHCATRMHTRTEVGTLYYLYVCEQTLSYTDVKIFIHTCMCSVRDWQKLLNMQHVWRWCFQWIIIKNIHYMEMYYIYYIDIWNTLEQKHKTKCFYFTYYSHVPLNNDLCVRIDESMELAKISINICVTNFYTSAFFIDTKRNLEFFFYSLFLLLWLLIWAIVLQICIW